MHHLYPSLKGDQLCPLGFHPQTRYPTRCKRCFRDYKEHGGRKGVDDVAASSPNLSDGFNLKPSSRTWTSSQNLSSINGNSNDIELKKRPQSWASTPDIDDDTTRNTSGSNGKSLIDDNNVDVTVKLPVPPRRHTTTLDIKEVENSLSHNSSASSTSKRIPNDLVILSTDNLAERVRKMNLLKKQRSQSSRESSREKSVPRKQDSDSSEGDSKPPPGRPERTKTSITTNSANNSTNNSTNTTKHLSLPPKKTSASTSSSSIINNSRPTSAPVIDNQATLPPTPSKTIPSKLKTTISSSTTNSSIATSSSTSTNSSSSARRKENERQRAAQDVEFMFSIKENNLSSKKQNRDNMSLTTETPYAGQHLDRDHLEDLENLRKDLEAMKARAEKAEREKSDILLRRLASMETAPNRTAASEALMLQQKVNELKEQLEKVTEEKRKLNLRMKEIENNPKSTEHELRRKLQAAEQICEELMEENQEAKKEIINLQAEMDELQDTFRDDEVQAKTNLQKDLEKTTKNCRILSFKLKKCERKIETLEQERQNNSNEKLNARIKQLENELRFSQELTKQLQAEADDLRNPERKKAPMLGVLGKSISANAKFMKDSLICGETQEDTHLLRRDLNDSFERESDLKDQLRFAEEEAENLRKKVASIEDENDSLMMQLKKMATRSRTRKFSPTQHRLALEVHAEHDEGISDEEDPAELRILLEMNEQESSILRYKVKELEKQNSEFKKQVRELQDKLSTSVDRKNTFSSLGNKVPEKTLKDLNDEIEQLRKTVNEKDKLIERLQSTGTSQMGINTKRQLELVEQEAATIRSKVLALETENERIQNENKRLQLQVLRKQSSTEKNGNSNELAKLKETLTAIENERDVLQMKLKRIFQEADEKLPPRTAIRITDLTPKNQLKKWVEELDDEISEMRAIVLQSGAHSIKSLENEKNSLEEELDKFKTKLTQAEKDMQKLKSSSVGISKVADLEKQLKKSEEDTKQMSSKIRELEEKIKKQDNLIKKAETNKASLEQQAKSDKDKLVKLEKDYEKEHKEREKLEGKLSQRETELLQARKSSEKIKLNLENEIKELKSKSSKSDSKQVQDLKKQLEELQDTLDKECKRYNDLNAQWEKMSEETILMRAQLTTDKNNLQTELNNAKQRISELEAIRVNRSELTKKLNDAQKKIQELETKTLKSGHSEYEKTLLQRKLDEKTQEYERLRGENEMNIDLIFQLRKDNDDLNRKLSDFSRIEQAQSSINCHSASLENEIRSLKTKLGNAELQLKSEVASTRLRYEQQVKTLNGELTSMQRQCERFKKDRDAFKQMLETAQKKIGDLKANNTGRQSRSSMHSSDEDDKSKIAYLEQQIGCLEDQLVEARLESSRIKTELVSERSANEIKISEMQSKLNEFEEERVIGSGRTKIPGMKTKLELSWQKEREDQQRLLQETSTLARDLRQTLFEIERERDKERLESKRRLDQLKRSNEEEMEEGRRKIAELQCDLLELRDVHAKLRTSNEKLRRERERYEKELIRRRMEQEGGERKIGALLHSVDELVKIAPDLISGKTYNLTNDSKLEPISIKRARSPSPLKNTSQIGSVLARLAEASEEVRKFQRINEEEQGRNRMRRGNLRRAASQENDPHGSQSSVASASGSHRSSSKISRSGSLIRKSLSLDHSIEQDQNIWQQDDGSISSMQSVDSELGGMVRDSSYDSRLDSRLSGGSTQSDIPRGPRKKRKGIMGKLRSLTKSSRNSESEISVQGSDSDISVASDLRASKKDLRGRFSGMFKRSSSTSRSGSTERTPSEQRPVAVTVVGDADSPQPRNPPLTNSVTSKSIKSIVKPPTPTTPITRRRPAK